VHLRGLDRFDKNELGVVACERLVVGAGPGEHSKESHLVARFVEEYSVAGGAVAVAAVAAVAVAAEMVMVGAV